MYMWLYPFRLDAELIAGYLHFWYKVSRIYDVHHIATAMVGFLRSLR
jgi:hypothetical protein